MYLVSTGATHAGVWSLRERLVGEGMTSVLDVAVGATV
jgi:hypothetical protein